jgi:hypothetical protein
VQSLFKGIEYHPICEQHLTVDTRVSDGDILDVNTVVLAVLPKLVIVDVRTQVCEDAMG